MRIFAIKKKQLDRLNIIAFTHASIGLKNLGIFHLEKDAILPKMEALKKQLDLTEIMYLSTCNRVEFILVGKLSLDQQFINQFLQAFNAKWESDQLETIQKKARFWTGINAVNHLIEVASSLDSMVLGEREIITQVRNAYEYARSTKLAGDVIRIVIRQTIETAKKVYTNTSIATKSVSIVALAYQELIRQEIPIDAKILLVGAGVTNQTVCKFLLEDGYRNLVVFNRTLSNAKKLATTVGGVAKALEDLPNYTGGFDVLISCTGAANAVVTKSIYEKILQNKKTKHIVDLAIPRDVAEDVCDSNPVNYISVETLKTVSDKNLLYRKKELLKARQIIFDALEEFKTIFEMRQVEIKMRAIPNHVKKIREKAINEVFSKEVGELDAKSKETLHTILNYMEKKYVSVPMIMAKEMLIKKT